MNVFCEVSYQPIFEVNLAERVPVDDLPRARGRVEEDPPLGPVLDLDLVRTHLAVGVHVQLHLGEPEKKEF